MEWSCLVACSVYGHGPGAARGKQGSGNSRVPQSQQLCHFLAAMVTEMPRSHCLQVWSRPSPWQRASRARLTPRLLGLHLKAGELSSAKGERLKVSLRDGSPPHENQLRKSRIVLKKLYLALIPPQKLQKQFLC